MQTTAPDLAPVVPSPGQLPLFDVPEPARLRSVREIAELAHVSGKAVYAAIHAGELVASRPAGVLRIALADAERWVRSTSTATTEPAPEGTTPEAGGKDAQ